MRLVSPTTIESLDQVEFTIGSGTEIRTLNLAVNSRLLYRLSYPGTAPIDSRWCRSGTSRHIYKEEVRVGPAEFVLPLSPGATYTPGVRFAGVGVKTR